MRLFVFPTVLMRLSEDPLFKILFLAIIFLISLRFHTEFVAFRVPLPFFAVCCGLCLSITLWLPVSNVVLNWIVMLFSFYSMEAFTFTAK